MRHFFCALLLAACATTSNGPHATNVAHVRLDIAAAMKTSAPERTIQSMGKTTDDQAIVYTKTSTGQRQEETWVKANGAWKLDHAVAADGGAAATAEGSPASSSL